MIVCSPSPLPIIKAALLAQLSGDLPCLQTEHCRLGLFSQLAAQSADQEILEDLIDRLTAQQSLTTRWLQGDEGRNLARLIVANLRYASADRGAVIFAAVEEALLHGPAYCLLGIGELSRLFVNRAKTVLHEVHRMTGFLRFQPAPDNTLVARPKLFHETGDWLIRQMARRYPGTRLVLLVAGQALVFFDGQLSVSTAWERYAPYADNREFDTVWETYYRSQYIESRRNDRQASRLIPKKYRNWLSEGAILDDAAADRKLKP